MSFKAHFLQNLLNVFPVKLRDVSEQQGERFHQAINEMMNFLILAIILV